MLMSFEGSQFKLIADKSEELRAPRRRTPTTHERPLSSLYQIRARGHDSFFPNQFGFPTLAPPSLCDSLAPSLSTLAAPLTAIEHSLWPTLAPPKWSLRPPPLTCGNCRWNCDTGTVEWNSPGADCGLRTFRVRNVGARDHCAVECGSEVGSGVGLGHGAPAHYPSRSQGPCFPSVLPLSLCSVVTIWVTSLGSVCEGAIFANPLLYPMFPGSQMVHCTSARNAGASLRRAEVTDR